MSSILKLLLIAAFLNGLSWIILIPVWQYPDEQAHFAQIQDVAELGKRPADKLNASLEVALSEEILGTQRDGLGNNKFTYHPEYKLDYSDNDFGPRENEILNLPKTSRTQLVKNEATLNPPLYPFLGSLFYRLFESGSLFVRVYAVRLMSLILFMTTMIVSYKIGQLIFTKNKTLPFVLASLVAFMPMIVFASTGVLPDPLTNLLFSLIIFLSLKILTKGLSFFVMFSLIIAIILGSLTRQQFLISIPIIVFPIIYQLIKNREQISIFLKPILLLTILIIVLSFFLPQFSFIKSLSAPEVGQPNLSLLFKMAFIDHFMWTVKNTITQTLPWYWGVYKWLSLTVPHINYQIINRLVLIAFIGIIIKLFQIIKNRKVEELDLVLFFMLYASTVYFLIFLLWDYFFYLEHGYSFGIQGRYFFPMITVHFTILVIGFWQLSQLIFKQFTKYLLIFIVFLMVIFNNVSLSYVSSSYYETSSISTFVKQVSQYKPQILKGNFVLFPLFGALFFQVIFLFYFAKHIIEENK